MRRTLLLTAATLLAVTAMGRRPVMVGHRGCGYAVENTAEAFNRGADMGMDYLECDVRVSADTVFVISHDETTERVGGSLKIAEATLPALKAERYTQTRNGVTYTGSTICTLAEYLDICRNRGVKPVIELKWGTGVNNDDQSNVPALISLIKEKGMAGDAILLTSMKKCLEYIAANYPEMNIQFLTSEYWPRHFDWCVEHKFDADINHNYVDSDAVRKFHDQGLKVNTWTINKMDDYRRMVSAGADMITTDRLAPRAMPD